MVSKIVRKLTDCIVQSGKSVSREVTPPDEVVGYCKNSSDMWVSLDANAGAEIKGIIHTTGGTAAASGDPRSNPGEDPTAVSTTGMDCVEGDGVGAEAKKKGRLLMDGPNDASACAAGAVWIGGIVTKSKGGKE